MPVPRSEPARRRPPGARRAALLESLRAQDRPLSVAELAPLVGLHPNTVRAHLDVLVRTGEVSRRSDARNTPGRPRELYEATGVATGDRNYRLLAQVLAGRLAELTDDPAREAVTAGRHWAEKQADDDATVAVPAAPAAPAAAPSGPLVPVLRMLRASGFRNIRVAPKDESKNFIQDWAPGKPVTDYVVSASIEAIKPEA